MFITALYSYKNTTLMLTKETLKGNLEQNKNFFSSRKETRAGTFVKFY